MSSTCPYYKTDSKQCNFYDTSQDEYTRNTYCLTSSNWRNCLNYSNSSYDAKVQKKLRTNPDL